jgi:hypothetical protein
LPALLGDWIWLGVGGFLFGVARRCVVGRTTFGTLCGAVRVMGYLSWVEGARDVGGDVVELDPRLCWLLWIGILDGTTPRVPEVGADTDMEVV